MTVAVSSFFKEIIRIANDRESKAQGNKTQTIKSHQCVVVYFFRRKYYQNCITIKTFLSGKDFIEN